MVIFSEVVLPTLENEPFRPNESAILDLSEIFMVISSYKIIQMN